MLVAQQEGGTLCLLYRGPQSGETNLGRENKKEALAARPWLRRLKMGISGLPLRRGGGFFCIHESLECRAQRSVARAALHY